MTSEFDFYDDVRYAVRPLSDRRGLDLAATGYSYRLTAEKRSSAIMVE